MSTTYPFTAWLMGPTSSGKTTISKQFVKVCQKKNFPIIHYDGDEIRNLFGKNFGFSEENRNLVIHTLAYMAKKANESGIPVIISALTAHKSAREYISKNISNLKIIYIKCPISVCVSRDPKGLYKKAINKEINTLIGYNTEYIEPINPNLTLLTNEHSIEKNTVQLLDFLEI